MNDTDSEDEQTCKRRKSDQFAGQPEGQCILCGKTVPLSQLCTCKSVESWKSLLEAAKIRNFKPILAYESYIDEPPPSILYERSCRCNFTHKKTLKKFQLTEVASEIEQHPIRLQRTAESQIKCIFCDTTSKYYTGKRTREKLTQSVDLRADKTIREAVKCKILQERSTQEQLVDQRILAVTTNDLVAYEAHYHLSCYKKYTKQYPKEKPGEKPVMACVEDEDTKAKNECIYKAFCFFGLEFDENAQDTSND